MREAAGNGGDRIALETVLANIAGELERLTARAQRLDEAVGEMLVAGSGPAPRAALLQDMDLLRQSLDCMQVLMHNLSRETDGGAAVSAAGAARGVYLAALRRACLHR